MVNSQNGWPAKANTDSFTRFNAGGRGWWAANSDVAVIFTDLIERFNNEVEPVIIDGEEYDDWSYANRLVRGSTSVVSNHGSATAVDINATKHPRGVKNTFKAAKRNAIRAIVRSYDGVIRWGGDYTTTVDDMHFEINKNAAETKRVANIIREKNVFTKEDKEWISKEIRNQIIDVLKTEKIVPNRLTKSQAAAVPQPAITYFTIASVLANVETDQDNEREALAP